MPHHSDVPDHLFAFSDRRGGLSTGRFAEANLSSRVGDDPSVVSQNRLLLLARVGLPEHRVVTTRQVHGARVVRIGVQGTYACQAVAGGPVDADGMVTTERNVALLIGVADCIPLVLVDSEVVGVLHIGWRGLLTGVVEAGVDAMVDAGARPHSTQAHLGPAIGPCHFAVNEELQQRLAARYPAAAATTLSGTPAVDLASATLEALTRLGIAGGTRTDTCTYESRTHFSARRDGRTGCQGGLVALL